MYTNTGQASSLLNVTFKLLLNVCINKSLNSLCSACCTLQLHFPVRSAQAHTALSGSQVWLSEPETLHSHWVHCGERGDKTKRQLSAIWQAERGATRGCPCFRIHQTLELQNKPVGVIFSLGQINHIKWSQVLTNMLIFSSNLFLQKRFC